MENEIDAIEDFLENIDNDFGSEAKDSMFVQDIAAQSQHTQDYDERILYEGRG
jgi:archaellum component FlaC